MTNFRDFEPAPGQAPGPAPAPAAPATPAAPRPATPSSPALPGPVFVGGKSRSAPIELDYPVAYGGKTYVAIVLRRPSSVEVGQFFERLLEGTATDPGKMVHFPIFVDLDDEPVPGLVVDFLDEADQERVMAGVEDFLPPRLQRFRAAMQPASTPADGAPTEPTSSS